MIWTGGYMTKRLFAEFIGTFWLVIGGCGSAVLASGFTPGGIGFLGVALAFGLSVMTMIYAVGAISGGHFNPAVTIGLTVSGRFQTSAVLPYIITQVLGATAAAAILYLIASGAPGFSIASGLASNGYGLHSPGGYSLASGMVTEILLTAGFVTIIIGVTTYRSTMAYAPVAIGMTLTLIHLISIPVTNTSVNPARSTGPAIIAGGWAIDQLWLFWLAPVVGALIGGVISSMLFGAQESAPAEKPAATTTSEHKLASNY